MQADVEKIMEARLKKDDEMREILLTAFRAESTEMHDGYRAVAIEATEMCLKLLNTILSLRKPNEGRGVSAIMDLTVGLASNPFWLKHSVTLMPILHIALQAQVDYALLMQDRIEHPNQMADLEIFNECKLLCTELVVMTAFLLGGSTLMAAMAAPLKRKLAPYLE